MQTGWQFWALSSALFAALTAILAKIGVTGVPPDLATFLRTMVILAFAGLIAGASGRFAALPAIAGRSWLSVVRSGPATGASWLCYFRALQLGPASRVAPLDKLSVVPVAVFGVLLLGWR